MRFFEKQLKNKTVIRFLTLLVAVIGLYAYMGLGKLEDPEFKIKEALVITLYPGATSEQVEKEVTDKIEDAVKAIPDVDKYESVSKPGYSEVKVTLAETLKSDEIEQYWDNLRRKVSDTQKSLPLGTLPSVVLDDYGDVYGMFFAIINDGYSTEEFNRYLTDIRRELKNVPGVARVSVFGQQSETVEVRLDREKMASMHINDKMLQTAFLSQNIPVDASKVEYGDQRIRVGLDSKFDTIDDIKNLVIYSRKNQKGEEEVIRLGDIAEVTRTTVTPVSSMMRHNGYEAVGLMLSPASGSNVVKTGEDIDKKIDELKKVLPAGIEFEKVYYQPDLVNNSIQQFVVNLMESVVVVVGVLLLTIGFRSGLIIGSGLVLSILGTFPIMKLMGIDVQRVSLGSFIIAMGILVDNAIVVVDEVLTGLDSGRGRAGILARTLKKTAVPLLGATLIAIAAFLPIVLMDTNMGEYIGSLFWVIAISLLLSWIFALTSIPVYCRMYLKRSPKGKKKNPRVEKFYAWFREFLEKVLKYRKLSVIILGGGLIFSALLFLKVPLSFFPDSDKKGFVVNIWLPEGTRIEKTEQVAKELEKMIRKDKEVINITEAIGGSPSRYYMMTIPETPNTSFAQLIISTRDLPSVNRMAKEILAFSKENIPEAQVGIRKYVNGTVTKYPIEVTVTGPDAEVLRRIAGEVEDKMYEARSPFNITTNWRNKTPVWAPVYSQRIGKQSMITQRDIASGIKRATTGVSLGSFKDGDQTLGILLKESHAGGETDMNNMGQIPVWGLLSPQSVSLKEVVDGTELKWENPQIWRENGVRAIKIQCDIPIGMDSEVVRKEFKNGVESIELPEGYHLTWAGQYAEQVKSSAAVGKYVPAQLLTMFVLCVLLFSNLKEPSIIFALLPLALIGIAPGLFLSGRSFGFMSIIGVVSLTGMMIKNSIILIEEINHEIKHKGSQVYDAIINSAVNRIRPVVLAAGTTILGMLPLITDPLYGDMALTIIFGLTAATVLTLVGVPLLYAIVYNVRKPI